MREHRGGSWERLADRLTAVDLSADLTTYEERRARDRAKLDAMIEYCQSVRCRSRFILGYFGERVDAEWRCHHCDGCDLLDSWETADGARPPTVARRATRELPAGEATA